VPSPKQEELLPSRAQDSQGWGSVKLRVDVIGHDEPRPRGVANPFALASGAVADLKSSAELASRLIKAMPVRSEVQVVEQTITPLTVALRHRILEQLEAFVASPSLRRPRLQRGQAVGRYASAKGITTVTDTTCDGCQYELEPFDPAPWNTPYEKV
jgi:hypothetical protein